MRLKNYINQHYTRAIRAAGMLLCLFLLSGIFAVRAQAAALPTPSTAGKLHVEKTQLCDQYGNPVQSDPQGTWQDPSGGITIFSSDETVWPSGTQEFAVG